jgi:hypothetical protein
MLTRNDKIRNSNRGVEKAHWKHRGCYVGHEKNLFPTIKNIKMFMVDALDIMLEDTKKYVGDIVGTRVENISKCFEPRVIWKHRKDIRDVGKEKIVF